MSVERSSVRKNLRVYEGKKVVVFDGVCNFCNWAVNFIIKRDKKNIFIFTPSQSRSGETILKDAHMIEMGSKTIVLAYNGLILTESDAILEIFRDLGGVWKYLRIFKFIPGVIRDWGYSIFSRYRYNMFGKRDVCMLPSDKVKEKFLV